MILVVKNIFNLHAQLSSVATRITIGQNIPLLPYFVFADSDSLAILRRSSDSSDFLAFDLYDKSQSLTGWLMYAT